MKELHFINRWYAAVHYSWHAYIYICEYVDNTQLHRMHMCIYIVVIALCRDDAPLAFVAHRAHFPWGWLHRSEMRGCWCGLMWRWQRGWRCLMLFVYVYCGVVGGYFYLHPISVLGYCCFKAVYSLSYIVYNDHSIMYNGRFETRID